MIFVEKYFALAHLYHLYFSSRLRGNLSKDNAVPISKDIAKQTSPLKRLFSKLEALISVFTDTVWLALVESRVSGMGRILELKSSSLFIALFLLNGSDGQQCSLLHFSPSLSSILSLSPSLFLFSSLSLPASS